MKTKMILTVILVAALAGAAGWFAPHSAATPTNAAIAVGNATNAAASDSSRKILYYACPMHPAIHYDKPGNCPICGMTLQPVYADATNSPATAAVPSCCGISCPAISKP